MYIVVLTAGHRPDDDRIYYKEIMTLLVQYSRIDLVAPVVDGETYDLDSAVVLHPLKERRGIVGRFMTAVEAAVRVSRRKPDVCHFHDLDFVLLAPLVRLVSRARMAFLCR